jgi:hypothetical protein
VVAGRALLLGRRGLVAGTIIASLVLAACSTEPSSPSAPAAPPLATACRSVDAARCARVLTALPEQLPATAIPQYVVVSESFCDGPCPGAGPGDWRGHVVVEYVDGREPSNWTIDVGQDAIAWEPVPTFMVKVSPASPPIAGGVVALSLGHCGLNSGIDVDRSYWDPVGAIDMNHSDAINAAEAVFTLSSPVTAQLVTDGGLVVFLRRHTGPKYLPGCM